MLDEPDQLAVIRGLADGCRDAWARLYDGYSLDVWRYVARLVGNDAAAVWDVVQETLIEAAQSARKFDPVRGTLWSWLAGIAHHQVAAHWRRAQGARALRDRVTKERTDSNEATGDNRPASHASETRELVEAVRKALAELPAEHAALLVAKYAEDRSLADLSRDWGSSIEATKSKLARARREFKAKFGQSAAAAQSSTSELKK